METSLETWERKKEEEQTVQACIPHLKEANVYRLKLKVTARSTLTAHAATSTTARPQRSVTPGRQHTIPQTNPYKDTSTAGHMVSPTNQARRADSQPKDT
jgi:hypothetical protein